MRSAYNILHIIQDSEVGLQKLGTYAESNKNPSKALNIPGFRTSLPADVIHIHCGLHSEVLKKRTQLTDSFLRNFKRAYLAVVYYSKNFK